MQYEELESQVYALLRSGRLADASLAVLTAPRFSGVERYDFRYLKTYVQLMASPANTKECLAAIEELISTAEATATTRLNAALLGAYIGRRDRDAGTWRFYLRAMWDLVPQLPSFEGRVIRSQALYHEDAGAIELAIQWHEQAVAWHAGNIGPHDEQDRLCQMGLSQASLSRLYAQHRRIEEAQRALDVAAMHIPESAAQRVYVPVSRMALCLATADLGGALEALTAARAHLVRSKDEFASHQVDLLEIDYLVRSGDKQAARILIDRLTRQGCAKRNLPALRQFRSLVSGCT